MYIAILYTQATLCSMTGEVVINYRQVNQSADNKPYNYIYAKEGKT